MYRPIVLYIALRYMRGWGTNRFNCFVFWLSTTGITLGVMALVTVLSVMDGFQHELESNVLGLMPQVLLTSHEWRLDPVSIPAPVPDMFTGVIHVMPLTTCDVVLQSAHNVAVGVMLGINPSAPEPLSRYLVNTHLNELIAGQYRVILGDGLAKSLNVKRGSIVRLMVPGASQLTPIGRIPSQRIFTVAGTFAANSEVDGYQLLVNQQDASRIMRYPVGYITGWRLLLEQPQAVDRLSTKQLPNGLVWHDWRERKGELFQAIQMEKNMMGLLLSLIIVVAAFNIVTSLSLMVMEKQAEVAILQTYGLTTKQVMLVFITQGSSAAIIGTLFGIGLGILLTIQLNRLMLVFSVLLNGTMLPVVIEPLQVMIIALSTIVVALLATIYPSWRAAAIHPAEALRYE